MSETVKNKHVKKKNSAVLLLKTVITAVLLFFTWYLCSHFMEYQKNATNQVNKYRIDQVCQLSAGSAVSQKFVAKHTHLKTVKVYFGNDYSGQASGKVILNIIDLETGKSIQRLTKNISDIVNNDYTEFKYRKQIYLLGLDYDNIESHGKPQAIERYRNFYGSEMETLYKGLLKHYSIKLSDNLTAGDRDTVYNKIFNTLADYVENILPIKMQEDGEKYKEVVEEYNNFDKFTIGKLDQNDVIEKNLILIGISRKLFTHSLPLVVAESCYIKLLKDARNLIVDTKILRKKEKAYSLLINIIEEYNLRVLLTKIYWDKPDQREEYKEFSKKYREVEKLSIINKEEYLRQKQILFLKADLKKVYQNENRYYKIIKFYKDKLVELGAMRKLKNGCISYGYYIKVDKKLKKVVNK